MNQLGFNMGFFENNFKKNDAVIFGISQRNLDYLVGVYKKLSTKLSKRLSV